MEEYEYESGPQVNRVVDATDKVRELIIQMNCGRRKPSDAYLKDVRDRELNCTPFDGHYGRAGWVFALNGSPPRGVIVAIETKLHTSYPAPIYFLSMDSSRRIGEAQAWIVRELITALEDHKS